MKQQVQQVQQVQQEYFVQPIISLKPKHQLTKLIQGLFPVCSICNHSQDQIKCDVYISTSQCRTNICANCFEKNKLQQCLACTLSIESHHPTLRTNKADIISQMSKIYNRNKAVRSKPQLENIEPGFRNTLAYFSSHPKIIQIKYQDLERQVLQIQIYKKNRLFEIITDSKQVEYEKLRQYQDRQKKRRSVIIGSRRSQKEDQPDMSLGYRSGLAMIFRTFGYIPNKATQ